MIQRIKTQGHFHQISPAHITDDPDLEKQIRHRVINQAETLFGTSLITHVNQSRKEVEGILTIPTLQYSVDVTVMDTNEWDLIYELLKAAFPNCAPEEFNQTLIEYINENK